MPAYKITRTVHESGFGEITEVFVAADSFAALADVDAAIAVSPGVFEWEETSEDLDEETGQPTTDELKFSGSDLAIETTDDGDAMTFVLEARDSSNARYVGLLVNPADPVEDADFVFRGKVLSEVSGDSAMWDNDEYDGDTGALRDWDFTASAFAPVAVLDVSVEDAAAGIDSGWLSANVADRLGLFKDGTRELRFANLVNMRDLLLELCQQAAAASGWIDNVVLELDNTDLYALRMRYLFRSYGGGTVRVRYSGAIGVDPLTGKQGPMPWDLFGDLQIRLTGDNLYTSYTMVTPESEEQEKASWFSFGTVADLLFAMAIALGCILQMKTAGDTVTVSFVPRSEIDDGETFLRDSTDDKIEFAPVDPSDNDLYTGVSFALIAEGPRQYNFDGGYLPGRADDAAPTAGKFLPITISPTWCVLYDGNLHDAGREYADGILPHNAIFYDSGNPSDDIPGHNLEASHTAIYLKHVGVTGDNLPDLTDADLWYPIPAVRIKNGIATKTFYTLGDYCNHVYGLDADSYASQRTITVPYMCGFRATVGGPQDWRNVRARNHITLDGQEFVVVGVRRKWQRRETELRLHSGGRFDYSAPSATFSAPALSVGPPSFRDDQLRPRMSRVATAGEPIKAGDAIAVDAGVAWRMLANHIDAGRFSGVAVQDADTDDVVPYQSVGAVTLPDGFNLTPDAPVYIRTATYPDSNVSQTLLTASNGTTAEDTVYLIGHATAANVVLLIAPRWRVFAEEMEVST